MLQKVNSDVQISENLDMAGDSLFSKPPPRRSASNSIVTRSRLKSAASPGTTSRTAAPTSRARPTRLTR